MSNKSRGSRIERDLLKAFVEAGWGAVRVAGSGSGQYAFCDVVAMKQGKTPLVLEVKSTIHDTISMRVQQVMELVDMAKTTGAKPWIVCKFRGSPFLVIEPYTMLNGNKYIQLSQDFMEVNGLPLNFLLA